MRQIVVILLGVMVLASPVFAKNYKKTTISCVPSPNPDVPPCDLDQTPLLPSEIAKKKADADRSASEAAVRAKRKSARQRKKETGY